MTHCVQENNLNDCWLLLSYNETRKQRNNIFKVLKEKPENPEFYTQQKKKILQYEGNTSTFSDKRKPREFIACRPMLQEMQKEVLQAGGK